TNLLATWTSGAMVPLDLMNDCKELTDAKLQLINDEVIPKPEVDDVHKHFSDSSLETLRAARGTGSAVRSMAMGGEIAFVIGLALSILEQKGIMPSSVEQLITLIYSTPTEVISMTSSMLAERYVGKNGGKPGARITTDAGKQSRMLAQITGSSQTTRKDLDLIARPEGERNAALGQLVTMALGTGMHYVDKAADLGLQYAGMAAAPVADALGPVVGPVLQPVGHAIAAGARVVGNDVLKPAGRAALYAAGAVHENAVMPAGRAVAAAANFAGPVLNPVGRGFVSAAEGSGQYVALPIANAIAASVDGAARTPGLVGRLADEHVVKPAVSGIDSAVSRISSSLRQRGRRDDEPILGDNNV
ncbi:MAG: hypothetical protein QOH33_868, partial [Paraburkholderia sp.]|nr:hypothetical protein [Paraburkholderia sp.]